MVITLGAAAGERRPQDVLEPIRFDAGSLHWFPRKAGTQGHMYGTGDSGSLGPRLPRDDRTV